MSSTISVEPSTSPALSHKVNGAVNQRLNLSTPISVLKHNSVIPQLASRTTPTAAVIGPHPGSSYAGLPSGPNSSINNNIANVTTNSTATTKPLLDVSRASTHPGSLTPLGASGRALQLSKLTSSGFEASATDKHGVYQMLASLALLCVLSLLMSFLALFFLQKLGPMNALAENLEKDKAPTSSKIVMSSEEYVTVYQVSVALSTLTIALDLCCLFVCCIQFLFAIKLMKTPQGDSRTHKFLKKSSLTRILAIGGFFLSIPVFFTGVILFTFIHFSEVPAIATSVVIGIGIVFCGVASVQNVYLWQWEKTRACQELAESKITQLRDSGILSPEAAAHAIELSTLV